MAVPFLGVFLVRSPWPATRQASGGDRRSRLLRRPRQPRKAIPGTVARPWGPVLKESAMLEAPYLLGIDYGTGGVRVGVFDRDGSPVDFESVEIPTRYPRRGIARGVGPVGDPPVLPGVTRLLLQPVQHPDQATAALLVQVAPAGGERRREQPSEHLRFRLAGQRPAGRHRPRRELPQQRHRRARGRRQRPRPLIDRRSRPGDGGRAGRPASAAHLGPCPNSTFSDCSRQRPPKAAPARVNIALAAW